MKSEKIKNFFNGKKVSLIALFLVSIIFLSACDIGDFFYKWLNFNPNGGQQQESDNTDYEESLVSNVRTVPNLIGGERVVGTSLFWDSVSNAEQYYVGYYTSDKTPELVSVTANEFNFSELLSPSGIYAFRVGLENNDLVELDYPVYYNPQKFSPYTENIFYFNGRLDDYYITSQTDLNNFVHYAFINRLSQVEVKFSSEFAQSLNGLESASLTAAFSQSFGESLQETKSFNYSYQVVSYYLNVVKIEQNFQTFAVPTNSFENPANVQSFAVAPYYETKSFEARQLNYDNFATDHQTKLAVVDNSEELYWAIESGATPIFENTQNNNGYTIYQQAKQVLREIVGKDMTNYEKVLSIYDWITINTVYDHDVNTPSKLLGRPYMSFTSFYLEGVFFDNLAVCDGFSKAFVLLANMEGIRAVRVVGDVEGEGHAWNKVYLDGAWYVLDITWTEITSDFQTETDTEYLTRRYFLVSDADIPNHIAHETQNAKNFAAPNGFMYYVQQTFERGGNTHSLNLETQAQFNDFFFNLLDSYFANEPVKNWGQDVVISQTLTSLIFGTGSTYIKDLKQAYANENGLDGVGNAVLLLTQGYNAGGYELGSQILVIVVLTQMLES